MRDLEIRDLVLRIPGVTPDDAQWIGEQVAKRLATDLSRWGEAELPALDSVRVRVASKATREELAGEIASAIARSLR